MNHLAHALLADAAGSEFALGSAQGDFMHGPPDPAWPAERSAGLRFHRAIDHYTDAHPEVVAARNLFAPPFRRYAGIALDVWFDHLLVRGWTRWCPDVGLAAFARGWLELLDAHADEVPESLRRFLAWMHAHGLPEGYGDDATLEVVFEAMARRVSRPSPLGAALPVLLEHAAPLQRHFDAFFPDLASYAVALRRELRA